ncbi:adenylyltransferase/cytidyltransferase family protein, partial [Enterococcus faecalis]
MNLLKKAKQQGDYLIVALSRDAFNLEKKTQSYFSYEKRKQSLEAI